jgi:hypothetical protein
MRGPLRASGPQQCSGRCILNPSNATTAATGAVEGDSEVGACSLQLEPSEFGQRCSTGHHCGGASWPFM